MKNGKSAVHIEGSECWNIHCKNGSFLVCNEILTFVESWTGTWNIDKELSVKSSKQGKTLYLQTWIQGAPDGGGKLVLKFLNGNKLDFRKQNLALGKRDYPTRRSRTKALPLPSELVGVVEPLPHVLWSQGEKRFFIQASHPYMLAMKAKTVKQIDERGSRGTISSIEKYDEMKRKLQRLENYCPSEPKRQKIDIQLQTGPELEKLPTIAKCRQILVEWEQNPNKWLLWKPCYRKLLICSQSRFDNEDTTSCTTRQVLAKRLVASILVEPERAWTKKLCNQLTKLEQWIALRSFEDQIDIPHQKRVETFLSVIDRLEAWKFEQRAEWIEEERLRHLTGHAENLSKTPLPTLKHLAKRHGLTKVQIEKELDHILEQVKSRATAQVLLREDLASDEELRAWEEYQISHRDDEKHRYRHDLHTRLVSLHKVARRRQLEVEVDFAPIIVQPCLYCGQFNPGQSFSGVDRVASSKHYVSGNCVPCCGFCNQAKLDLSLDEFLKAVGNIVSWSEGKIGQPIRPRRSKLTYSRLCSGARKRGLVVELTEVQALEIAKLPCHYCGISDPNGCGIDRVDNQHGYTLENSVPSCWSCNRIKFVHTKEFTLAKCIEISARTGIIESFIKHAG